MFKLTDGDETHVFDTENAVYTYLGQTASADYTDKVETWINSQSRSPLEVMNGPEKDVWTRNRT